MQRLLQCEVTIRPKKSDFRSWNIARSRQVQPALRPGANIVCEMQVTLLLGAFVQCLRGKLPQNFCKNLATLKCCGIENVQQLWTI